MSIRFHKLIYCDARLVAVPDDYAEPHELVLVRRVICGVEVRVIIEARAGGKADTHKKAVAAASKRKAYGVLPLQAGTPEEIFLVADRSQYPAAPALYFPDIMDCSFTWTNQVDASGPAGAWGVGLRGGGSYWGHQSDHGFCRAVCPSQDILDLGTVGAL